MFLSHRNSNLLRARRLNRRGGAALELAVVFPVLLLLIIGIRKRIAATRYAGLALLGITVVKLFFHDLSQLDQLYRIGAFIAVAVIAILASFLYQRFLAAASKSNETNTAISPAP